MNHADIRARFAEGARTPDEIFSLARSVAYFYQKAQSDMVDALDLVIRLIDRRSDFEGILPGIGQMIDAIGREAGLYPYIAGRGNWRDELAVELMKAPGLENIVFHIEQALVFHKLAEGKSIILSAPTSFGKSLLIDALIAHRQPPTVVAVVPTIALLDEFRRRMEQRFPQYQVITLSDAVRTSDKAIFIGTQERLLERADLADIDLFIIDEFYKLDLDRNDRRSLALNAILARYGRTSKQIYFLGPSIDDVPNAGSFRPGIEFIKTRYSPVTADIVDRTAVGPSPGQLVADLQSVRGTSSLIYVQSPPAASRLVQELIDAKIRRKSAFCVELADWLATNFHPEWILAASVARGIGIHHGRIPRSLAHLMISLFNKSELAAIVCTSSMIEGINTAAENVFIYDRNISTSKLDRFTFDNIKGRAGRMFKHNVGKIFLYNSPPDAAQFDVRVPLFNADELMAPELLLQIQDDALTPVARRRKRAIADASGLPAEVLSTWAEFGVDALNRLADSIRHDIGQGGSQLVWKGIPSYDQVEATYACAWTTLAFQKHDMRSPAQLALFSSRLWSSPTIRDFLDGQVSKTGLEAQPEIDQCFNFMRGAEYTFPQVLRAINDVVNAVANTELVNYRVYASELQNLFFPGRLRALDEYGVPLPLVRKVAALLPADDLELSLSELRSPGRRLARSLTPFEADLLARGLA